MSSTEELEQAQNAIDNLQFIEEEIEASSQYFKPKPGKTYIIKMDRTTRNVLYNAYKHIQKPDLECVKACVSDHKQSDITRDLSVILFAICRRS